MTGNQLFLSAMLVVALAGAAHAFQRLSRGHRLGWIYASALTSAAASIVAAVAAKGALDEHRPFVFGLAAVVAGLTGMAALIAAGYARYVRQLRRP